jgi:hypothetical protein
MMKDPAIRTERLKQASRLEEDGKVALAAENSIRMRTLILAALLLLAGCLRNSSTTQMQEDKSIVFPEFYAQFPVIVGKQGQTYELDGVTLRALTIALNDSYPPDTQARSCWDRPESLVYRVIRQGDIIFVSLGPDPAACNRSMILFDSGVEYAISLDGRILRRLFDGEPREPLKREPSDAGVPDFSQPVPYSKIGVTDAPAVYPFAARARRDGGVGPDGGSPEHPMEDAGTGDGGTSAGPSK